MAYQRVDIDEDEVYEGWSYFNYGGDEEYVTAPTFDRTPVVEIRCDDQYVEVFKSDIPKLIKALEAAYNHKE